MGKIDLTGYNELPKAKKTEPIYSDEYKKITDEADMRIEAAHRREAEAYIKSQLFIARSADKDPVITLIKLIRSASSEEEARTMLVKNFNLLLEDEEINYIINHRNIEGPMDDTYKERQEKEIEEAAKILNKKKF